MKINKKYGGKKKLMEKKSICRISSIYVEEPAKKTHKIR